jgi:hypothetical protein
MSEQRRLAAIVSADVAGYSRLMGRDESPRDFWRATMHMDLAVACFIARRYADGVHAALTAATEAPTMAPAFTMLAANHVGMGEIDRARAAIDELNRVAPEYLGSQLAHGWRNALPQDTARIKAFLRIAAGLEDPSAAEAYR